MKKLLVMFITLCMVAISQNLFAQEIPDTTLFRLITTDGNNYFGKIVDQDSVQVRFDAENLGELTFPRSAIKLLEPLPSAKVIGGKVWPPNTQSSRYFFAPNAYGLKKGEGYYQNVWVLFNQFSLGVTRNFSIGVGMVPLFLFAGAPTPIWIIPKLSFPVVKDKFQVGAGGLFGAVLGADNAGFGIAYGTLTFGSRDANASIGIGYGYAGGTWSENPTVNFSAFARLSPKTYFVTENYYISAGADHALILSAGFRSIINRVGIDYGLFMPFFPDQDFYFALPWLGFTVPFNVKKSSK